MHISGSIKAMTCCLKFRNSTFHKSAAGFEILSYHYFYMIHQINQKYSTLVPIVKIIICSNMIQGPSNYICHCRNTSIRNICGAISVCNLIFSKQIDLCRVILCGLFSFKLRIRTKIRVRRLPTTSNNIL